LKMVSVCFRYTGANEAPIRNDEEKRSPDVETFRYLSCATKGPNVARVSYTGTLVTMNIPCEEEAAYRDGLSSW
jgi:hypothetical protein